MYEPSTIAGVSILCDFHQNRFTAQGEPFRSDLMITAAASLAQAVSLMGQQVGLFTNGRDAADRIRSEGYRHDFQSREIARERLSAEVESDRLTPVVVPTSRGPEQFQRIHETLARIELTDGLTFPELISEVASRLPRDATVLAILPFASEETALSLGALCRSGYAVSVLLMMYGDEPPRTDCAGRLIAEGIDVRLIESEEQIADLCNQKLTSQL